MVASPSQGDVMKLSEKEIGGRYIELPKETVFVESCGVNEKYNSKVYIPLQKKDLGLYIYEAEVTSTTAKELWRVTLEDKKELVPYGCALTSTGGLWICLYNANSIIHVDLATGNVTSRVEVPAPNDCCVDPLDESIVYVAAGAFRRSRIVDPTLGRVYKVSPKGNTAVEILSNVRTLAGIEKMGETIYAAQLFDVFKFTEKNRHKQVWRGDDTRVKPAVVWLADNLRPFNDHSLLMPAYRTLNRAATRIGLGCGLVAAIGNFFLQLITCVVEGDNCFDAFRNPDVLLDFSILETTEPLRFAVFDTTTEKTTHYEVHLDVGLKTKSTNDRDAFFDANVTHISRLEDNLICVNFQQPRLLVLPTAPFETTGPVATTSQPTSTI